MCSKLAHKIKSTKNIKGIKIEDNEYLMSQYADDTVIILDGTENSLRTTIEELDCFNRILGLKINLSKTHLVWIGSKNYCSGKLCQEMNFQWTT